MKKPVSNAANMRSASKKTVRSAPTIIWTITIIVLVFETRITKPWKMVSRIPAKVSALEKMVSSFKKIFSIAKNIFSITKNMVGNDRRCKLHHFNNLIIDQEDGRKDEEDLLVAFDHNLWVRDLGLGVPQDGRKPSDYFLHDRADGLHVQDNLLVR
jgi:hypothetical protein